MYKLPPLYKPIENTPVPECVYKMKKISDHFNNGNTVEQADVAQIGDADMADLDRRWTEITSRLEKLQADITAYKATSETSTTPLTLPPTSPPVTIDALAVQQSVLLRRISSLMSSLSELKMRLAVLDDPKNFSSTVRLQLQQMSLLERIKELNDEIRAISSALSNNNSEDHNKNLKNLSVCQPSCCNAQDNLVNEGTLEFQDLVITANPSRPPHSLPLIKQQLEKLGMHVYATTHVHSTAYQEVISDDLRHFIQSETNLERRQAQIALTLIWRKEKDDEPSLMVSPSTQAAAIKGEANIARYLIRSVPRLLNYESDPLRAVRIDELLDLTDVSAPLGASPSKKERPAALQLIEKLLADSQALDGGNELTALDFVVYSAVVNSQLTDKELGPNIKAWMQRCKPAKQTEVVNDYGNGSAAKRTRLERCLAELGVVFRTLEHPAAFTVAEMMQHVSSLPGLHAKNLLVKDKKSGRLFLITARHDAPVQLNQIAKAVGAKELRFADAETLESTLGVQQGSVTPFALMNDAKERRVTFVLDRHLWEESAGSVNFHPLTNEATTNISVSGFRTFLQATGHEPIVIQL